MLAAASCAPSMPPCSNARRMRFRTPKGLKAFCSGPTNGISSVRPTPAPFSAASLRIASSVPSALARSLASPAPAAVAKPAAIGSPMPGIMAGAYVPAIDPTASPNLPVRVYLLAQDQVVAPA